MNDLNYKSFKAEVLKDPDTKKEYENLLQKKKEMKKLIKMPSIGRFRHIIKNITLQSQFCGLDAAWKPIYDITKKLPVLRAVGTVKLHGTNASVCYNDKAGLWFQSKENIITPEKDNAGFAFFAQQHSGYFKSLIAQLNTNTSKSTITVYGEWAGAGIQKGVGISKVPKSFFIFGVKISDIERDSASWLPNYSFSLDPDIRVFDLQNYKTYEIEIDFNNPLMSNNQMVDWVYEVENKCPVAKAFGVSGIGEGIVFSVVYNDAVHRWKMKGEKHASGCKVKTVKKIDDVKLLSINNVIEKVTPLWRLEQMYQETFDTLNGGTGNVEGTGDFIRSVVKDILKEESDVIADADLSPKDINSGIAKIARIWFIKKLDEGQEYV